MKAKNMKPSKFEFILFQGSAGSSYALRLEGEVLHYLCTPPDHHQQGFGLDRIHRYAPTEGEQRKVTVSEQDWELFESVLDDLDAWNWDAHYDDPNAMQGVQWSIHFIFDKRELRCGGANAYPGKSKIGYTTEFKILLQAVKKLLAGLEFGCL